MQNRGAAYYYVRNLSQTRRNAKTRDEWVEGKGVRRDGGSGVLAVSIRWWL